MMVRDEVTNPAKNKRHALRGIEKKEIYSSTDENVLFQEIVDTINHIDALEEEEPSEERIVTSSEALLGCDNVLAYIAQKNLNVDFSVINTLNNLRKKITQTSVELARQTTLEEYLTFDA